MWYFDKVDRLDALMARCREAQTYLARARCDLTGAAEIAIIDARLAVVGRRFRRLSAEARRARRLEQEGVAR